MIKGFWNNLKKPYFVLAPMSDITDAAFRQIIAKYGKPDVTWTEFVSCDGLCSPGKENLLMHLQFTEAERPIVVQFFGANPINFHKCAEIATKLGFDGIDINMGCPDKNVEKQGAGARLMLNHVLARTIIRATKKGAGTIPVSVKTRIGYHTNTLEQWLPELLAEEPAAITIHGRTRKELSLVLAHWDAIARAVDLAKSSDTLIIGNGDVKNLEQARQKAVETGVDGVMLGRSILGNPWLFNKNYSSEDITIAEKLTVLVEHAFLFEKLFSGRKNFVQLRKHFCAYIKNFTGAKTLRLQLMETNNALEVQTVIQSYLESENLGAGFMRLDK